MIFRFFEDQIHPTETPSDGASTPFDGSNSLLGFYSHFTRQVRGLIVCLFLTGLFVALFDAMVPMIIGRIVTLLDSHDRSRLFRDDWQLLAWITLFMFLVRPSAQLAQLLVTNQALTAGMTNLIRWQSHWHVVRQSLTFFQNELAGRVASRVLETAYALRESVVQSTNAVWYIVIYGGSAILLLASADFYLALPVGIWFCCYAALLRLFIPVLCQRSSDISAIRAVLTGRVVDLYTNILTVKLFARASDEDALIRETIDEHTASFHAQLRAATHFGMSLAVMNACMIVAIGVIGIFLWRMDRVEVGTLAMALPLAWQIANTSGRVAQSLTTIFGNVGVVQDGMRSIAVPRLMPDVIGATELAVLRGQIQFNRVFFSYRAGCEVLRDLSLDVSPGERIGVVGESGAGKSTLINLLLRFYEPESGQIVIDGQDIARVTQESLRSHIAVVSQDISLLNRSIRDNIRYGRPWASDQEVIEAAQQANAADFIAALQDKNGQCGLDAHVGERGVKLSGGQRQRVAIARAILKNAPILALDEATSALDSELEAALQANLERLMGGRTVIVIAHRLSTLARMDRVIVIESGRIAEQGTHEQLLSNFGPYARLWRRQSGGFSEAAE